MSLLKGLLNETRKINEEDLFSDEGVGPEVAAEAPVEVAAEVAPEGECTSCPEITDELVAELTAANPAIAEVDPAEFKSGLEVEVPEHLESLGGDMNLVAKIVLDHLNKFPGKDFYGALRTMLASLEEPEAPVEGGEGVFNEDDMVEENKDGIGDNPTTDKAQPDNKAMSQVKNESAVGTDVAKAGKAPGSSTTPEEKKDEKDQKATWAKEKAQEEELMKKQKADDKVKDKNVAEAHTADKQSEESLKSAGSDAKKDHAITSTQAAAHKAADKKDMNKKDVNPIKVTPRA